MLQVPQALKKFAAASCRQGHRKETETEPDLTRVFAADCDKHRDVEQVRRARQRLAPPGARRRVGAWNHQYRPSQDPRERRDSPSRKHPRNLPRQKGPPKRMNHKNYTRVRLTAIRRHTASMFLSPMSFALRTHPLR